MKRHLLVSYLTANFLALNLAPAGDWPNWRGPSYNGSSEETGLPETFSRTENVQWSIKLPGRDASTPVIWGSNVFVSSTDETTKSLVALAFRQADGMELWRREVGYGISRDTRSTFASPSPTTDGVHVVYFYGNGDLVCLSPDGKLLWRRSITSDYGEFAFQWTFSSSPVLFEGRLYLQVLQRDVPVNGRGRTDGPIESFLLCLDPQTGRELWRHVRTAEARAESLEAFTTPVPFVFDGRKELLIAGADCITGHNPETGSELWRWGTWNPTRITHWRLVPSPLPAGPIVLVCAPKGDPVYAIKAGLSGVHSADGIAWVSQDRAISSDVATPLYYRGDVYLLNSDRKILSRIAPSTGEVIWSGELDSRSKLEASPLGADGKIYMMNHEGVVFVAEAGGRQFKLLHQAEMGTAGDRELRSSIAAAGGRLFIRTGHTLYCLAK